MCRYSYIQSSFVKLVYSCNSSNRALRAREFVLRTVPMSDQEQRTKYPASAEWKASVKAELKRRGYGAHSRLCEAIGCSTGQLTDLLSPKMKYSHLVPTVQRALGWDEVQPPIPGSRDTGTILYLLDRLNDKQKEFLREAADLILRTTEHESTEMLAAMLKHFRMQSSPLRNVRHVRVLLIEADPQHQRTVRQAAAGNSSKISLFVTDNILDGLLLVGASKPDVVIIDDDLHALDACRRIKANPDTLATHVAIAMPMLNARLLGAAKDAGAWRAVAKPIDLIALLVEFTRP